MDLKSFLFTFQNEVRLYVFLAGFGLFALWESFQPRRRLIASTPKRWLTNFALAIGNSLLIRMTLPLIGIGAALAVEKQGWGLLKMLTLPGWQSFIVALLLLDIARYSQHVALHKIPLLWRFHKVHHADVDYDCTTGLRFHPFEAFFSEGILIIAIALIGPSPSAVLVFEIIYLFTGFLTHGNIGLPVRIDSMVRLFLVTPDMHRVHHSSVLAETNSNYGGVLPWWDRLFGTYRAQPVAGHEGMTIGLDEYSDANALSYPHLLAMPFESKPGSAFRSD